MQGIAKNDHAHDKEKSLCLINAQFLLADCCASTFQRRRGGIPDHNETQAKRQRRKGVGLAS